MMPRSWDRKPDFLGARKVGRKLRMNSLRGKTGPATSGGNPTRVPPGLGTPSFFALLWWRGRAYPDNRRSMAAR